VEEITSLAGELSDITHRLGRLSEVDRRRAQFEALLERHVSTEDRVNELRPRRGKATSPRILDARVALADSFNGWLVALDTPNVTAEGSFDEQLRLFLAGERFTAKSPFSGSTRTRIVLAYHAALIEAAILLEVPPPQVLVLDAPRQHELDPKDIRAFVSRFTRVLAEGKADCQLVLSAVGLDVLPKDVAAVVWKPTFDFEGEPRFLGPCPKAVDERPAVPS